MGPQFFEDFFSDLITLLVNPRGVERIGSRVDFEETGRLYKRRVTKTGYVSKFLSILKRSQCRAMFDQAAINLMRIPILYPTHRALTQPALYQAGDVLQNAGRADEAQDR